MFRAPTTLLREVLDVSELFEERMRRELTVNPTDLEAMVHLLTAGPLTPSELAKRLGISTASTTTAVDRLVALGHVTREPHPTDRRGVMVVPTAGSRTRALGMLMPMIQDVDRELDDFTAEEQEVIARYLSRVIATYRAHAAIPDGEDAADQVSGSPLRSPRSQSRASTKTSSE